MSSEDPADLTPAQTEAVRRALRAARHEAPLPVDVATRLDATLAGLVADAAADGAAGGAADGDVAPVLPLRRRRWPAVLAAAAAVTAIGLAGTQLVDRSDRHASSLSADGASRAEQRPTSATPDDDALDSLGDDSLLNRQLNGTGQQLTAAQRGALADEGYRRVRPTPWLVAALASKARAPEAATAGSDSPSPLPEYDQKAVQQPDCELPVLHLPQAVFPTYYLARHDGERVVLVVLPGPQVSAYPCGGGDPTPVPLD